MIKSYDTQTVGSAMIDAIVAQRVRQEIEAQAAAAAAREKQLNAEKQALKRRLDGIMHDNLTRGNARKTRGSILAAVWWALVGWTVLAFGALFDALGVLTWR